MTDVPPDNGAPGPVPAGSEPPVARRSNFAPPPAGAEPPVFDDDALAEAMAAEVRPYTEPIKLPRLPAMPPPAGAEFDAPPVAPPAPPAAFSIPPDAPVAAPDPSAQAAAVAWDGAPLVSGAGDAAPDPALPLVPAPAEVFPAAEPSAPIGQSAPTEMDASDQEELLRALGGASTLEAIERLENELRLISSGEQPTIDLASTPASEPPLVAPAPVIPDASSQPSPPVEPALEYPAPGHFFPPPFAPIAPAPIVAEPATPEPVVPESAALESPDTAADDAAIPVTDPEETAPAPATDFAPTDSALADSEAAPPVVVADPGPDALAWLAPAVPSTPIPPTAAAAEPPLPGIPGLPPVDESLIDPVAAAELRPAPERDSTAGDEPPIAQPIPTGPGAPWWAATAPVEDASNPAAPADPVRPEPTAPEPAAPEPIVLSRFAPPPTPPAAAAPQAAPGPGAQAPGDQDAVFGVAVPISTEPPVGPESPDWLDAPPPVYTPPELVEPPTHVDAPPSAALDPVAPITANTMVRLPMPLPTDRPHIEDRAELPPPPGYEDIPITPSDAMHPVPVAPAVFFPPPVPIEPAPDAPAAASPAVEAAGIATQPDPGAEVDPFAALVAASPAAPPTTPTPPTTPEATEPAALDHDDDDVIDEVDRVAGTGALPISAAGTIAPLAPVSEPIPTTRLGEDQPALVDEQAQQPSAFEVETAGPEPTALDLRAGRAARLFWLWFAANSSVLSVGLGAVLLATGMSLRQAIVATLAGVAISFLPLGLGTLAGKWSGQPTMIVSRAAFGHAGNILPALLAIVARVLWGGVLLWLLATAVAQVLVGAGLDAGLGATVWQLVGLVVGFVIATVIAVFGYGFVAKVQLVLSIVSGLLILGSAALTYQHLDFSTALLVPDGSWILVISGAALVFSVVGLAWVHSSSDLARYQRPSGYGGSSMLWATFGATLPPFLLIVWGAMLAASDPKLATALTTNPLAAIASLLPAWYPAPLLAAAALGLLSGAVLTMYSGGFALQALGVRMRRSSGTLVAALLVLAAAAALIFVVPDFGSLVRDLVITVAVPVAAWAGIFASEMMIRTRPFDAPSLLTPGGIYPQVRWPNFVALIVISVIGLGLVTSSIPGLGWEGFLYGLFGIGRNELWASSDAGVFVALLLGILVPLAGGVPAIRRQERTEIVAD